MGNAKSRNKKLDDFNAKYLDKEFTQADINNPEIFYINEIQKNIHGGNYGSSIGTLVKKGMDIVNENDNFSLKLNENPRYDTIYINDKNNNDTYEIRYINMHCVYVKVNNKKEYCFNNLSQVELYFDTKRDIMMSKNIKLDL